MSYTEKMNAINTGCASLHKAQHASWKAFCGLTNDPLHKQPEVQALVENMHTLRDVRGVLREEPLQIQEVMHHLENLKNTVFSNITNVILQLNIAAAGAQNTMDTESISSLKHDTEGALSLASKQLRFMFGTLGIMPFDKRQ